MTVHVMILDVPRSSWNYSRVVLPAEAIEQRAQVLDVRVHRIETLQAVRDASGGIAELMIPQYVQVLVLTQPVSWQIADAIVWIRTHRPDLAIVIDVVREPENDDAYSRLRRACALADVVTVSTERLFTRFSYDHRRTFVIRDSVHPSMLEQPARTLTRRRSARHADENRDRIIGWVGSPLANSGNLLAMQGSLSKVVGAQPSGARISFRGIGDRIGLADAVGLREDDVEASGALDPRMQRAALDGLDIGVIPVEETDANIDFPYVTALEMAAAGVPVVATATPEHVELRNHGLPMFLVGNRHREWVRALRTILAYDDKQLRTLAIAHRENVRRFHLIDHRVMEWVDAWREAVRISQELMI